MGASQLRDDPGEEARFRRLLAERLPRHRAPDHLREAMFAPVAPPRRPSWWPPVLSALATTLVLALVALPFLPRQESDSLRPLLRAALSEHTRSLLWGKPGPEALRAALPRLMEETGVRLTWFFGGDEEVQLISGEPAIVDGRRALALTYKDRAGHMVTYLLVPGAELPLPDRGRVQIDRFRPFLTREDSLSLLVWKQENVACFLISDMVSEAELGRFKSYFLKVRRPGSHW